MNSIEKINFLAIFDEHTYYDTREYFVDYRSLLRL
jgi:hypothetical protein